MQYVVRTGTYSTIKTLRAVSGSPGERCDGGVRRWRLRGCLWVFVVVVHRVLGCAWPHDVAVCMCLSQQPMGVAKERPRAGGGWRG